MLLNAWIVAVAVKALDRTSYARDRHDDQVARLQEYMHVKRVPSLLQRKLLEFQDEMFEEERYFEVQEFLPTLPPSLHMELLDCLYIKDLRNVDCFANLSEQVLVGLSAIMKPYPMKKDSVIYQGGDVGREAFIINCGIDGEKASVMIEQCVRPTAQKGEDSRKIYPRAELERWKVSKLRRHAAEVAGISEGALDEAADSTDTKDALIKLIADTATKPTPWRVDDMKTPLFLSDGALFGVNSLDFVPEDAIRTRRATAMTDGQLMLLSADGIENLARDHPNLKEEVMKYRETRAQELGETVTVRQPEPEPEPELDSGLEAGRMIGLLPQLSKEDLAAVGSAAFAAMAAK